MTNVVTFYFNNGNSPFVIEDASEELIADLMTLHPGHPGVVDLQSEEFGMRIDAEAISHILVRKFKEQP